jgi:hypothetical protein
VRADATGGPGLDERRVASKSASGKARLDVALWSGGLVPSGLMRVIVGASLAKDEPMRFRGLIPSVTGGSALTAGVPGACINTSRTAVRASADWQRAAPGWAPQAGCLVS